MGVDLIQVARIGEVVDRYGRRFLERVYTRQEREYCLEQARGQFESLAARWAAKEATFKVLGTGPGGVRWKDIEVCRTGSGEPKLRLSGEAKRLARRNRIVDLQVSMSHSDGLAVAFVVAAGR